MEIMRSYMTRAAAMERLTQNRVGIFTRWVQKAYPDRANKILNQIKDCHGGSLNDSRYGARMKGEGKFVEQVAMQFKLARKLYLKDKV